MIWLKERSPLPLFADENYLTAKNVDFCAECYHGVNVKLVKTGGISGAYDDRRVRHTDRIGLLAVLVAGGPAGIGPGTESHPRARAGGPAPAGPGRGRSPAAPRGARRCAPPAGPRGRCPQQ